MNSIQNKEMTMKYMKKLMHLNGFVKQLSFSENNKEGLMFKQHWEITFVQEEESFVTPTKMHSENEKEVSS